MSEHKLQVHIEDERHALIQWNDREVVVYVQNGQLAVVVMAHGADTVTASEHLSSSGIMRTATIVCKPAKKNSNQSDWPGAATATAGWEVSSGFDITGSTTFR